MNMQAMMKQAQKMQKDMEQTQQDIDSMTFEGTSNNVVTVKMKGNKTVVAIDINDELMDDKEMLVDMIIVATNNCIEKIDSYTEEKMSKFSSALGGLF